MNELELFRNYRSLWHSFWARQRLSLLPSRLWRVVAFGSVCTIPDPFVQFQMCCGLSHVFVVKAILAIVSSEHDAVRYVSRPHRRAVCHIGGCWGFHGGVHVDVHRGVWIERIRFNLEPASVKWNDFVLVALAAHADRITHGAYLDTVGDRIRRFRTMG